MISYKKNITQMVQGGPSYLWIDLP